MIDEKQVAVASAAAPGVPDGWRVVRFGDMVQNVDLNWRVAAGRGVERYVGLDHLDPQSLHIRRWGLTAEGTTFTRGFAPGHVLFGKRRAYQRKAAVASFEGVCSGDILVFEPKDYQILPRLLPFIVQSDGFFEHALGTSAGSLSPRTKWSDLARYEFVLPPKDEQRRIADILWAADDAIQRFGEAIEDQRKLKAALACDSFVIDEQTLTTPLGEVGTWMSGGTPSRARSEYWSGSISWASPKDMKVDVLNKTIETISEEGAKNGTRLAPKDSIFIVIRGMILAHTFPVAIAGKRMAFNQDMKALIVSQEFKAKFIFHWLLYKANDLLGMASESSHGTKRLPTENLFQVSVPKLPIEKQIEVVELLEGSDALRKQLEQHRRNLQTLKTTLLQNLLAEQQINVQ